MFDICDILNDEHQNEILLDLLANKHLVVQW